MNNEVEQRVSIFNPRGSPGIIKMEDVSGAPIPHGSYRVNSGEEKFAEIFSKLYKWLDSLIGRESFYFVNPEFPPRYFVDIFEILYSQRFIANIRPSLIRYNDAPPFLNCDIYPNFSSGVTDGNLLRFQAIGHGFGKDPAVVFSRAIGEFLERYFLTLYHQNNFLRSSYASLEKRGVPALNPVLLAGFSSEQKERIPRLRFGNDSVFYWEKGRRALTEETILIPAQLIYWNYDSARTQEPILVEPNTNGAGGYFTKEGSILSGLYELIQRDAFLIYWLNELAPPRIIPESVPHEQFQTILGESKRYGFKIHCLNTTLDTGVPSFVVVIIDESGEGPHFLLGGGCGADPVKAMFRALEEAWSVYYWIRPRPSSILPKQYKPFYDRSVDQDVRLRLCANKKMAKHYDFFLKGELRKFQESDFDYPPSFSSAKEELSLLIKKIEGLGEGYEVFYYSPEHPILNQLGYHSSRVIVSAMTPLYLREPHAPLGAKRLKEVPQKLGLKARNGFYPIPHPFP